MKMNCFTSLKAKGYGPKSKEPAFRCSLGIIMHQALAHGFPDQGSLSIKDGGRAVVTPVQSNA
jgi:hypothetical protein